ncbi:3',5'-nucleoside bisphosphate phosphatase isoform X2 [Mangifera indica]|uniref:3',5'-nucleoside bisphosphate phosphatase isoform X2 n=1 Tax=Mangifera indica TaxID=29780 RepID=UPI001CF9F842|nr:3',5'-nucleoside bisphosphate phosphatase isoform X2 [Mangifera indica]
MAMVGDAFLLHPNPASTITSSSNSSNSKKPKDKKKKKKRGGTKKKMTAEQTLAFKSITEWVYLDQYLNTNNSSASSFVVDDFGVPRSLGRGGEKVVFELHSHSKFSDGFLSPSKLVERAHGNGVKVLALTDHDTLAGIPEAIEAARRFGIKIIPGVEISTIFSSSTESEEPVHILAYYSSCGPARYEELERFLATIRDGRYSRAKDMVLKLNKLKLPLKWEHVAKIAGKGVAPGRLHVARAMVEAGYVENLKQAFARYLYDGGPAYSTGSEPLAEEAVQLIVKTGGLAVLAHPWALKNPVAITRRLKDAGLHGMEVYRSDGRLAAYSDLADAHGLLKLGGSDYHGRGGHGESELGSVNLPVLILNDFLKIARPIWCAAIKDILKRYADEPSESNLSSIMRFVRARIFKGSHPLSCGKDLIDQCLSLWLTKEERQNTEFEAMKLKLSHVSINQGGINVPIETK